MIDAALKFLLTELNGYLSRVLALSPAVSSSVVSSTMR